MRELFKRQKLKSGTRIKVSGRGENVSHTFSIIVTATSPQDIVLSAGAEKTVSGTQYGGSVMYETKKAWGAGAFYQAGFIRDNGEGALKNPFYGIALQVPIARSQRNHYELSIYYMLWPYFGGTLPAPHNVTIQLKINT